MPEGKNSRMHAILASTRAASAAACDTADELLRTIRQSTPPNPSDEEKKKDTKR